MSIEGEEESFSVVGLKGRDFCCFIVFAFVSGSIHHCFLCFDSHTSLYHRVLVLEFRLRVSYRVHTVSLDVHRSYGRRDDVPIVL